MATALNCYPGLNHPEIAKMVGLRLQTVRNIHSAYLKNGEEVLHLKGKGRRYHFKVPKSTIYRLLHRPGWRKRAPRGKHPEGDEQAIGQFKKTSHGS